MQHDSSLQQLSELITSVTGWHIRPQDYSTFERLIRDRCRVLKLPSLATYYELLHALPYPANATAAPGTSHKSEWEILAAQLTVKESYFFRDRPQFALLEHQILPSLLRRKRQQAANSQPTLRIWSAGCATGEEAYSLAILVRRSLPDWPNWNLHIIGTDLNPDCIHYAQQGVYNAWSFRLVTSGELQDYLEPHQANWRIHSSLRQQVQFHVENLVCDRLPNTALGLSEVDLIVCRNVFIYFAPAAIAQVLKGFYKTLAAGGYLLTGHTELHKQSLNPFLVHDFPESTIYQKPLDEPVLTLPASTSPTRETNRVFSDTNQPNRGHFLPLSRPRQSSPQLPAQPCQTQAQPRPHHPEEIANTLATATAWLTEGNYAEALACLQHAQILDSDELAVCILAAQIYANQGQYAAARAYCEQAMRSHPFACEPIYVLAHIAEDTDQIEEAKRLWQRMIYLEPNAVLAYLNLATLYEHEQNLERADKLRRSALRLLAQLSPETYVDPHQQMTVEDLRQQLLP